MAFSDLFISGAQRRNIGHYASIVKLALVDEIISEGEQKLLDRMANRLNINTRLREKIRKNPDKYPINPPVGMDNRIERLYHLSNMIFADTEAIEKEAAMLVKVSVGLGFPTKNVDKVTDEAIKLAMKDTSLTDFTKAIKIINKE
ncbi:MAG: TerB family tellurite resistance protein [Urechidicola sp.]|nr:TerB family tellurite resistance protein [Urechidicola sp.]